MGQPTLLRGYQPALIAQVSNFSGLNTFELLEAEQPEGSLLMAKLTYKNRPADFACLVDVLNRSCIEKGVTLWPGSRDIAFAHPSEPVLYICWRKGFVWWGWILAILGSLVLPPLITAGLWLILPESVKQMVELLGQIAILGLAMFGVTKMTKLATAADGGK